VLVSVIAATLATPAVAAAKEIKAVQLCGASQCFTFDRGNSGGKLGLFAQTGPPAAAPRRAAPWYRLRTRIGGRGMKPVVSTSDYVPSLGVIRVNDEGGGGYGWYEVNDDVRPVLRNVAARLAPRPPATLHVTDIAPGVPAPTPAARTAAAIKPRESGTWNRWLIAPGVAGCALLLAARGARRRRAEGPDVE
jgi:hypothetical protein